MKTIITPTDFSDSSVNAARFAADMALAAGAKLLLYHAVPDRIVIINELGNNYFEDGETEEVMEKFETLQEQIKNYTHNKLSVDIKLKHGDIDFELEEMCRHEPPFAVVISATEKDAMQRFLFCSHTLAVSHNAHVPYIIVPEQWAFKGFRKFVLATDLDDVCNTMPLDKITGWASLFKANLEIISVRKQADLNVSNVPESIALQTHFRTFNPKFHYLINDDVVKGINNYVSDTRADLLIIVPKKHSFLHKSLSRQFVLHPAVPTMILSYE